MAGPLLALLARATVAMRGVAAGNAARAGAGQAAQQAAAAAQAQQAREAMRQGVRMAQEAAHSRQQARASGTDGSLTTTFNQAKGALAYGMKTGDSAAIEVGLSRFIEVGKKIAPLPAAIVATAVAFALLPKKLSDFASSLLESRRQFAEVNGSYAVTFAKLDAQKFGRSVRLAGMTSGTTSKLADTTSQLQDRLVPYAAGAVNILNVVLTNVEKMVMIQMTIIEKLSYFSPVAKAIEAAAKKLEADQQSQNSHLLSLTERIAGGMLSERRWKK